MNNAQFRKLVLDTSSQQSNNSLTGNVTSKSSPDVSTSVLGSCTRNPIPMTPRSICNTRYSKDFARQLALQETTLSQPTKKSQSSVLPKGTKFPVGYIDRTKSRFESPNSLVKDEKGERVKALEQLMKSNQIDETTFIGLRDEILGEEINIERAGLVKGLDRVLLKKVKSGEMTMEDILRESKEEDAENSKCNNESRDKNIDDEFDKIEEKEVQPIFRENIKTKGEMAPPALTGKKRTRDQILSEMKAARKAAIHSAPPRLGSKFKKVGEPRSQNKIIMDAKGRKILITVDENGNEKRKVRKLVNHRNRVDNSHGLLIPDKDAKPLGMIVPEPPKVSDIETNMDIFDDVGDDYDPLAEIRNGEDSDEDGIVEDEDKKSGSIANQAPKKSDLSISTNDTMLSSNLRPHHGRRDYFQTSLVEKSAVAENIISTTPSMKDATIMAALKKASQISLKITNGEVFSEDSKDDIAALHAKQERHKRMLQQDDRDAQDLDLGFGSSRIEDDDDADVINFKMRERVASDHRENKNDTKHDVKGKRKRGPKKRKADINNATDVLRAMKQIR